MRCIHIDEAKVLSLMLIYTITSLFIIHITRRVNGFACGTEQGQEKVTYILGYHNTRTTCHHKLERHKKYYRDALKDGL